MFESRQGFRQIGSRETGLNEIGAEAAGMPS